MSAVLVVIWIVIPTATGATENANDADCSFAVSGSGSPDWREKSEVAGPVGVFRNPLRMMFRTGNGQLVTKMPILVESHKTVTVSVPSRLRHRVFLYYGRVLDRNGNPTTGFSRANGYSATKFYPCASKPRTAWPGGIRVKGGKPVHLTVTIEGRPDSIPLPLGRPKLHVPK